MWCRVNKINKPTKGNAMMDSYTDSIFRFRVDEHRHEDTVLRIGIERAFCDNPLSGNYGAVKTGKWIVAMSTDSMSSTIKIPMDAAPEIIAAIAFHASECNRRNNPVPVDEIDDDTDAENVDDEVDF